MNDIFISYKVHNRKTAIEYYKSLKAQGFQVWFDQLVPKGADWRQTIEKEIKASKVVVCLLSEACLLDDWVLFQIRTARKYHKDIKYIALDETNWQEYKAYHVKKEVYQDLAEVEIENYFLEKENEKIRVSENTRGLPVLCMGLMICLTICFVALALLSGVHFLNLSIDYRYGLILAEITILLGISYIPKRFVYFLHSGLAIGILCMALYLIPPYYISSVSVNSIFFLLFYLFAFLLRYTKINLWLGLLASIFYSILCTGLFAAFIIFINHFFDYDCSWISIIILCIFLVYKYWGIKNDYR